jgi:hypothetical protein
LIWLGHHGHASVQSGLFAGPNPRIARHRGGQSLGKKKKQKYFGSLSSSSSSFIFMVS